jgi:hypothetical protein
MNIDERYFVECYKDFIESGLSITAYAEKNKITYSYAERVINSGKLALSSITDYDIHILVSKYTKCVFNDYVYRVHDADNEQRLLFIRSEKTDISHWVKPTEVMFI